MAQIERIAPVAKRGEPANGFWFGLISWTAGARDKQQAAKSQQEGLQRRIRREIHSDGEAHSDPARAPRDQIMLDGGGCQKAGSKSSAY